MAKRHAEPLMCHVPVKRLLREPPLPRAAERRLRGEPARPGSVAPKRPLEEAETPPGKRPGTSRPSAQPGAAAGGRRRHDGLAAAPQDERAAEGCAGGRGKKRASAAAEQEEEEFYQYNSFLYWRAPLPTIDLSDIQNLDGEIPSNVKTSSRTDATETEMET